jgi:hypothetical protein
MNRVRRLIFHIGAHKTGTTAIQASLGEAAGRLLREQSVLYPRAGRGSGAERWGHAQLARELLHTEAPIEELASHRDLLDEVASTRPAVTVLSSEDLSASPNHRPIRWASLLSEELASEDVRVVAYVRPQWEYIEASYAQRVRTGETWEPFEEYLDWVLTGGARWRFDYVERFGPWRAAFGERLEVRPYAISGVDDFDAVKDFWSAVGLGSSSGASRRSGVLASGRDRILAAMEGRLRRPPVPLNRRPGGRALEMLREIRALLHESALDEQVAVGRILEHARRRLEAELPDDTPFRALTPETVSRIAGHFARSNQAFIRDYLGAEQAELFKPPARPHRATRWSLDAASERERRLFDAVSGETLEAAGGVREAGGRPLQATGRLSAPRQRTFETERARRR